MKRERKPVEHLLLLVCPVLVSAALTIILYGGSLSYGFMFDDPLDLPRASGRSYLEILTSAGDSSYYRPLILIIWKILYDFLGRNDGTVLHSLALVAHVVNGWLVYRIGSRLQGIVGGYASAILFLSFPLSYQAVAYVNAFFHTLVTTFLLCSVVAYWKWREGSAHTWLAVAVLSAILAVFTHEYGVTAVALIATVEIYYLMSERRWKPSPAVGIFLCISTGFLILWLLVPRWQHSWELSFSSVKLNSEYFFQGLVYPVAGQLSGWSTGVTLSPGKALLLFGIPVLVLLVVVHLLARRVLSLAYALVWTLVAIFPALISLPFNYLLDGPRLFYISSVGISLAWAGALSAAFPLRHSMTAITFRSLSVVLLGAILVQSVLFVQERNVLLAEGAKVIRNLALTATDPSRPGRTYVNFPAWFAPKEDYLIGHTGVVMIPEYTGLSRAVYVQTGEQPDIVSIGYDVIARDWDYHYGLHGRKSGLDDLEAAIRRGGGVYATRFYSDSLKIEYEGAVGRDQVDAQSGPYLADLGGWGRLVSAEARVDSDDHRIDISMHWDALGKVDRDYTMFVHVYDAANKLVAQADGYPIGQMFPPSRWRPGDSIDDHRRIELPSNVNPGNYRVVVGVYDRQNGQRVPALDAAGNRYKDDGVTVGTVTVATS